MISIVELSFCKTRIPPFVLFVDFVLIIRLMQKVTRIAQEYHMIEEIAKAKSS
jgi:hypothetical protein